MTVVIDSSVLLAVTFGEPGAERALPVLPGAVISAVNASEVVSKFIEQGANAEDAAATLGEFDLQVAPFDEALALAAGLLRRETRSRGLSLGDRACLALASRDGARVLTADRAWDGLDIGVHIDVIR